MNNRDYRIVCLRSASPPSLEDLPLGYTALTSVDRDLLNVSL